MAENSDFAFYTTIDDEMFDELTVLNGEHVVLAAVWEDSLAEALAGQAGAQLADDEPDTPDDVSTFDVDLYLEGGVYFELYGASLYDDTESEPLTGVETVQARLRELIREGVLLGEIAVDEEDGMVLVLQEKGQPVLYIDVGGFVLEEWVELPD